MGTSPAEESGLVGTNSGLALLMFSCCGRWGMISTSRLHRTANSMLRETSRHLSLCSHMKLMINNAG